MLYPISLHWFFHSIQFIPDPTSYFLLIITSLFHGIFLLFLYSLELSLDLMIHCLHLSFHQFNVIRELAYLSTTWWTFGFLVNCFHFLYHGAYCLLDLLLPFCTIFYPLLLLLIMTMTFRDLRLQFANGLPNILQPRVNVVIPRQASLFLSDFL